MSDNQQRAAVTDGEVRGQLAIRGQLAAALVRAGWDEPDRDTIEALVPLLDAAEARGRAEVAAKVSELAAESPEPGHSTLWLQGRLSVMTRLRALIAEVTR